MSNNNDGLKLDDDGDWKEYRMLVIHELRRHSNWLGDIASTQKDIAIELSNLKGKCVGWSAAAGIVVTLVVNVAVYLLKKG